jgi:hypothetical protein
MVHQVMVTSRPKLSVALELLSDLKHVLKEDAGLSLNFDSTQKSKTKFLVKGIRVGDAHARCQSLP